MKEQWKWIKETSVAVNADDTISVAESTMTWQLVKSKYEIAKAELRLNIKKTKEMSTEEVCNFNIGTEEIENIKYVL